MDVIRPALQKANPAWHGWHAFRRGLATNLHRLGVSDKVIQQILRHATVSTTMNIYVKTVRAGRSECDEVSGNDVCNYCATREARKYANYVEVILVEVSKSRRRMQLGEIWRRGGI